MQRRFALLPFILAWLVAPTRLLVSLAAEGAPPPGTIVTVAGTGQSGFSGDGGPATQARLDWPLGVAVDGDGNVLLADNQNQRLRRVSPSGIITTVAGTGFEGFAGDGGPAALASLDLPQFPAVDGAGNLYVPQWARNRVRKVSPEGIITTVAGSGPTGSQAAGAFAGDGGPATAARLYYPHAVAVDAAGDLFIADTLNQRIRKVSPDGIISTVAGRGPTGPGNGASTGDGGPATEARLNEPLGLAVDGAGNLYVSERVSGSYRVRKVSADGIISTVAGTGEAGFSGDGGPATEARLNYPGGLAVDTAGNLFIADWNNYRVRKVDPNGIISTVAGIGKARYAGDGVQATATGLRGPIAVAVDAAGNLLIAETGHYWHEADGLGYDERILKVFGVAAPGLLAGVPFPAPQ